MAFLAFHGVSFTCVDGSGCEGAGATSSRQGRCKSDYPAAGKVTR